MSAPREVEAKFLVRGASWRQRVVRSTELVQGYLRGDAELTVRIRLEAGRAVLAIKGPTRGRARTELEFELHDVARARAALRLAYGVIEKTRHVVPHDGVEWVVDEFRGENEGLLLCELELPTEAQLEARLAHALPPWVGRDVSGEERFRNSALARRPFSTWSHEERAELAR